MTAILLAAASALVWGTADYSGGRATRRASALGVTVASQLLGLPVLALCVLMLPGRLSATDAAWGAGAGVAGLLGIAILYRSLSTGAMTVAAPITAVTGALVPMGVGLATQALPSGVALAGAACAVVAIGLVGAGVRPDGPRAGSPPVAPPVAGPVGRSGTGLGRPSGRVVVLALLAGACFGAFFVLLAQTHDGSGMWPLVAARGASVALGLVAIGYVATTHVLASRGGPGPGPRVADRGRLWPPRGAGVWVALAGTADVGANALFLLAARSGPLGIVAPIAALYPVSTVVLALVLDREGVRAAQVVGLGLAAAALVLTAV